MKKQAALLLAGVAIAALAPIQASAESTTADVTFTDGDAASTVFVKPGTGDDLIDPDDGTGATTGALRINWVPNIKFGEVAISVATTNHPSLITTYDDLGEASGAVTTTGNKIPQFVQISDTRGTVGGDGYTLKATASIFNETGGHTLDNTRIQFYSYRVTNSTMDKAATGGKDEDIAASSISGIAASSTPLATGAVNQLEPTQDIVILKTATKGDTDSSVTSLVFDQTYRSDKDYSSATTNDQIKLHVPMGESAKKVNYTSTLTWTLAQEY